MDANQEQIERASALAQQLESQIQMLTDEFNNDIKELGKGFGLNLSTSVHIILDDNITSEKARRGK